MISTVSIYDALLDRIDKNTTIVTSTRRLAREIRFWFGSHMARQGHKVWETPDVLPWSAWLIRSWEQASLSMENPPTVLTDYQCRSWWEMCIQRDQDSLLQSSSAAKTAFEAWKLICAHQIPLEEIEHQVTGDTALFAQWLRRYLNQSHEEHWLDSPRLPEYLIEQELIQQDHGRRFVFVGFDDIDPQIQRFLRALQRSGTPVDTWLPQMQRTEIDCHSASDEAGELYAVARACQSHLQQFPESRLGVVVPRLPMKRAKVEQIFRSVLSPTSFMGRTGRPLFHLSSGKSLGDFGLIQTALWILQLFTDELNYRELLCLIQSPFLGDYGRDTEERLRMELSLRQSGRYYWSWNTLLAFLQDQPGVFWDRDKLVSLDDAHQHLQKARSGEHWARLCSQTLRSFGWPGDKEREEWEGLLLDRWSGVLDQVSSRDVVLKHSSFTEFVLNLKRSTQENVFETPGSEAPIQIVGVLESSGLCFDHLYVVGLSDDVWPHIPRGNPFLSPELRHRYDLPGSGTSAEFQRATQIHTRLANSASRVSLSYPRAVLEEPKRPSPLLSGLSIVDSDQTSQGGNDLVHQLWSSRKLETIEDTGPGLGDGVARGGSGLIKSQAACPFQAFAKYRLSAKELAVPTPGFDALQRGNFVHRVLQRVWDDLEDQETLNRMPNQERETLVLRHTQRVLEQELGDPENYLGKLADIEVGRIAALCMSSLNLEEQRTPFKVRATELAAEVTAGPLTLNIKMDRVDETQNGVVLIDYKTGDVSTQQWVGDRPGEPQLLLYSRLYFSELSGLAFAKIRANKVEFVGVTREAEQLPDVAGHKKNYRFKQFTWDELQSNWLDVVNNLAKGFYYGDAWIDPLPKACDYCHLKGVCRIAEKPELEP